MLVRNKIFISQNSSQSRVMVNSLFRSYASFQVLNRPQLDVKAIITQLPCYIQSVKDRKLVNAQDIIDKLDKLPGKQQDLNQLNKKIKNIQIKRKAVESAIQKDKLLLNDQLSKLKELKQQFLTYFNQQKNLKEEITEICGMLPNLIDPSVPRVEPEIVGWINPRDHYISDPDLDHYAIMLRKKLVDFHSASLATGASWYYLINEGAMLEHALVQYVCKKARSWGFKMCLPPSIARNEVIDASGFRPKDMNNEQQIYHIKDTQMSLTATSEITIAALGLNKIVDLDALKPMVGVSRCYRAEAGAYGKDTKGLYRVHEFTKVEFFYWTSHENSSKFLNQLLDFQIAIFSELGLSARVLNMPMNDLGAPAYKKYDIEAWMPGRGSFGEISSASNCTDFQSRRLNTRYEDKITSKLEYIHTLNGTAMAVPRVILAIVENLYNKETDKIAIPKVLQPYMDNIEHV